MKKIKTFLILLLISCLSLTIIVSPVSLAETFILCDVNSDGDVNAKDSLALRQFNAAYNVVIDLKAADLNGDKDVNAKDSLLLRQVIANIITKEELMEKLNDSLASNVKTIGAKMTSPISDETYELVWIDDFDSDKLNESDWSYYTRNYNGAEESVNRVENVHFEDGNLVIYGKKEDEIYTGDAASWETPISSDLTGGAINTNGKKQFQYGRLEIKSKIPYSYGIWSAFWTMGINRGWPWGGEVDIMEFVGGTDRWNNYRDDEYLSNLHWCDPTLKDSLAWGTNKVVGEDSPEDQWNSLTSKLSSGATFEQPNKENLNNDWHIYGVEWTEEYMSFYCDDEVFLTVDITRESMREAFHQPHYIILNLVMGGSWAGRPNENTVFPQKFIVDWVKVWQK